MFSLKRTYVASILLAAIALSLSATSVFASELATDVFDATATSGVGQPSPVDVDPRNMIRRADGAIGFGYSYRASGQAFGEIPGSVQYEEHGYLFFRNPAIPASFIGSRYDGGKFILKPSRRFEETITIADSDPAAYQSAQRVLRLPGFDPRLDVFSNFLLRRLDLPRVAGEIHYGVFTFTDPNGTFWGVSTPDSRHFLMRLKFEPTERQPEEWPGRTGSDSNLSTRFGEHAERRP